jgi:hypothetical protein
MAQQASKAAGRKCGIENIERKRKAKSKALSEIIKAKYQ